MSAILSADDLNDFISPGVACIKPVETLPLQKPEKNDNPYEVTTEDQIPAQNHAPAQISLTDCLACSGCVTSAEAVLVSLQSHSEVLNTLDSHPSIPSQHHIRACLEKELGNDAVQGKVFVASVSPQVRASIAATYGISERRAGWVIDQLLSGPSGLASGGPHGSAFTWIVDTNVMREAALVLGADEIAASTSSSTATTSSSSSSSLPSRPKKPILTSACPGWICYAEKTHPHVLPHLSRLKSPQALTGTLLKTVLSQRLHVHPDRIWHLAVMPCFDKKLEASREELTDVYWRHSTSTKVSEQERDTRPPVRDVDCVITARELLMLADTRGISFPSLPQQPLPKSSLVHFPDPTLDAYLFPRKRRRRNQDPAAGPSGGYLHHVLQTQLSQNPNSKLQTTRGRNADVVEYAVTRPRSHGPTNEIAEAEGDGRGDDNEEGEETIFKAARYYGFRNIQNLVRKLKPPRPRRLPGAAVAVSRPASAKFAPSSSSSLKPAAVPAGSKTAAAAAATATPKSNTNNNNNILDYAYVEVMACPGGCTNGGGQIKVDDLGLGDRSREEREGGGGMGVSQKEWLAKVDEAYFSMSDSSSDRDGDDDEDAAEGEAEEDAMEVDVTVGEEGMDGYNGEEGVIGGVDVAGVRRMLRHWSESTGVGLEELCFTTFRQVKSDVGQNSGAGAQDRVVELAGRIGGGW
ncbi:MAG: hypothetical protein LQ352_002426 [Teloschistes flavicans]|nr:MAG: hypothetical protein LQ352_002426 [Teloschistes flavicans]